MPIDVTDPGFNGGYNPADDAWAENFVFSDSDGYLTLVRTDTPEEYDDDEQLVAFVEAGDKMTDLLRKMRTFTPDTGSEHDQ